MNKKLVAAIAGGTVGVCIGGIIKAKRYIDSYIEGYGRGISEFYEEQLDMAYEHISVLNQQISERDKLLERSTAQTKRMLDIANNLANDKNGDS